MKPDYLAEQRDEALMHARIQYRVMGEGKAREQAADMFKNDGKMTAAEWFASSVLFFALGFVACLGMGGGL